MTEQTTTKIILITYYDEDIFGGTMMVSHGINNDTLVSVALPNETLSYYIKNKQAVLDEQTTNYCIPYTN